MTDKEARKSLMLVMGFKYFDFKANSSLNRVNHLVGAILDEKFDKDEVKDAAKLYKVLKKKEDDKKKLMDKEEVIDKKRDRKANDKMNKDEFYAHINIGMKAYHKQKLTEILTKDNIKMMN